MDEKKKEALAEELAAATKAYAILTLEIALRYGVDPDVLWKKQISTAMLTNQYASPYKGIYGAEGEKT